MNTEIAEVRHWMHLHFSPDQNLEPVQLMLKNRYVEASPYNSTILPALKDFGFRFEPTGANTYVCMNYTQIMQLPKEDLSAYLDEIDSCFLKVDIQKSLCQNGRFITLVTIDI